MPRLNLTVEGQTEQTFAVQLLEPHLAQYGVLLGKPTLTAKGKKGGLTHRGGLGSYLAFRNDLLRRMKEDRQPDIFFSTMVDLYALPKDFPGQAEAAHAKDPYARVAALEEAMREDIGDRRFLPYIQLHEFEALLLSDPSKFASYYEKREKQIQSLVSLCGRHNSPEQIDDGKETAPSKRIIKEIPGYRGAKCTAGPFIAAEIGLDVIRGKCRHFRQWLTGLERLGGKPQSGAAP